MPQMYVNGELVSAHEGASFAVIDPATEAVIDHVPAGGPEDARRAVAAAGVIVAAADTVMNRPSRELLAEFYPGVPLRDGVGEFDTLLAIDKARRLLGYEPQYSWREHVQ